MSAHALFRGHKVIWNDARNRFEYEDGIPMDAEERPCTKCGKIAGPDGHDPCLGKLPGVKDACCGHGKRQGGIIFENGTGLDVTIHEIERDM
ncbi:hypothetical protein LCGC14_2726150 [marine sediment metagenome]|uniref:Uncharacterized protein n=1 Tax=marine sediment metagenome TaxID=412755 RepID=A0A0F8ZW26_9ZZZZ